MGGRRYVQGVRPKQQPQYNGASTSNYFDNLPAGQSDPYENPMRAGKRVLSSPEQEDTALKRSREQRAVPFSSIEDTEEMESPQGAGNEPGSVAQHAAIIGDTQSNIDSQPGTNSDSYQGNTQTITVDVHQSSSLTDQADSYNGENSSTHETPQ